MNQRVQGATLIKSHFLRSLKVPQIQELDHAKPILIFCLFFPNSVSLGVATQARFGAAFGAGLGLVSGGLVRVLGCFREEGFGRIWCRFGVVLGGSGAGSGAGSSAGSGFQRFWCGFRAGSGRFRKCLT